MIEAQDIFNSMIGKDLRTYVDLSDDSKYAVKGKGAIMFKSESGGSFEAGDILYVPKLKKNFLLNLVMEDMGFFRHVKERESTHMSRGR